VDENSILKKMKNKIIILAALILTGIGFQGCEKETTAGFTDIVYYADLQLEGASPLIISLGAPFTDPGYIAIERDEDVTDKVEVSGTVDVDNAGVYNINYSVTSADGFTNTVTRQVFVLPSDALISDNIPGVYMGQRAGQASTNAACTITQVEDGAAVYYATDFFGGSYNVVAGYGPSYSLKTYFYIGADNSVVSLSNTSPWGAWELSNGAYSSATSTFVFDVEQDGFGFNVTLKKQ